MTLLLHALPPGEHRPVPVALHPKVPHAPVLVESYKPSEVVDDHRAVLHGAVLQGNEDITRSRIARWGKEA